MADSHEFLRNLALVLGVAAVTTVICRRINQPVIFGYLVAGMIVGPHVPIPLAADAPMVHTLSELGVILLMFALGLEFSLRKLLQVGGTAGIVAVLQCSVMIALGYLVGRAFGWTGLESVYTGAIIAISSTTIIVKALAEQKVTGRFTEVVFGVLIIEDLIAILLLAVMTTVSAGEGLSIAGLAGTAGRLSLFLIGLTVVGLLFVPRLIRYLAKLDRPETMVVAAVGLCFGAAYLAASFGYSVALGAFLAGAIVAESGEEKRVEHLVQPVRDVFAAIFFVAVGMMIDPRLVAEHWLPVAVLTVAVVAGKVIAVSIGAFLTGSGVRTSVQTGMSLAQIGEFSFIIAGVGLATGATRPFLYPVAVAVSALTTLSTPWLIRMAGPAASYVDRKLPAPLQTIAGLYASWIAGLRNRSERNARPAERRIVGLVLLDTVVIGGIVIATWAMIGRLSGWIEARTGWSDTASWAAVLVAMALLVSPFLVGLVRHARNLIHRYALRAIPKSGSGSLDRALAPRRALVVTWQLAVVALAGVPLIALAEPIVPKLVSGAILLCLLLVLGTLFWRSATSLQGHAKAGAEVVVAALARQLSTKEEEAASPEAPDGPLQKLYEMVPGLGEPVSIRIEPGDVAAGRTLSQLDLRDATGATVLAIIRGDRHVILPVGRDQIMSGDVLALAGTSDAVANARTALRGAADRIGTAVSATPS